MNNSSTTVIIRENFQVLEYIFITHNLTAIVIPCTFYMYNPLLFPNIPKLWSECRSVLFWHFYQAYDEAKSSRIKNTPLQLFPSSLMNE